MSTEPIVSVRTSSTSLRDGPLDNEGVEVRLSSGTSVNSATGIASAAYGRFKLDTLYLIQEPGGRKKLTNDAQEITESAWSKPLGVPPHEPVNSSLLVGHVDPRLNLQHPLLYVCGSGWRYQTYGSTEYQNGDYIKTPQDIGDEKISVRLKGSSNSGYMPRRTLKDSNSLSQVMAFLKSNTDYQFSLDYRDRSDFMEAKRESKTPSAFEGFFCNWDVLRYDPPAYNRKKSRERSSAKRRANAPIAHWKLRFGLSTMGTVLDNEAILKASRWYGQIHAIKGLNSKKIVIGHLTDRYELMRRLKLLGKLRKIKGECARKARSVMSDRVSTKKCDPNKYWQVFIHEAMATMHGTLKKHVFGTKLDMDYVRYARMVITEAKRIKSLRATALLFEEKINNDERIN